MNGVASPAFVKTLGRLVLIQQSNHVDVRTDAIKTWLKEIGLRAQNFLTILGSIINITGGTYMTI